MKNGKHFAKGACPDSTDNKEAALMGFPGTGGEQEGMTVAGGAS